MKWFSGTGLAALLALGMTTGAVAAEKQYGPGVTDTEIKIGNILPYSGPASVYGAEGKAEAAYFAMINDQGGINGRKINFISRDDAYSPPKTVEVAHQLVEQDQVLLLFGALGTAGNLAIRDYMNEKMVPQLFVASGASQFNDPKHYPWTMGFQPSYRVEARAYARYILENVPDAKIAVLYQNDDFGKDFLTGLRDGLGDKADKMIVATQTYQISDATVDPQIVALQGSGANVLLTAATPKFATKAISKVYDIGWKPTHFLVNVGLSVMQPAEAETAVGIISVSYIKGVINPRWQGTPEINDYLAWMKKYYPSGNVADGFNAYGYTAAQLMVYVLKQCGDNLTRENVMKQAASIHDLQLPLLYPGITVSTSPTDFAPIKQMQLIKFNGKTMELFGEVISGAGEVAGE